MWSTAGRFQHLQGYLPTTEFSVPSSHYSTVDQGIQRLKCLSVMRQAGVTVMSAEWSCKTAQASA
jgi:hypothetical protein